MKIRLLIYTALPVILFFVGACSSASDQSKNLENSSEEVDKAKNNLIKAQEAYNEELENFREEMKIAINNNKAMLKELRDSKWILDQKAKKKRIEQIAELQKKNDDLEFRLNNTNEQKQSNWKKFKEEFNYDMNELGKSIKDISNDNVK